MFDPSIVCCYLYSITRYGYPPPAERTGEYLREMKALGFHSVEVEGIPGVRHYDEEVLLAASLPSSLDWNRYWASLIETFQAACEIAAAHKLTFHLHPCLGVLAATTDAYRETARWLEERLPAGFG